MEKTAVQQNIGTGRRKTASARVILRPGKGRFIINDEPWNKYFNENPHFESVIKAPLRETHTVTKYDVFVRVQGGGINGQAEAIRHGVARALVQANESLRPTLKKLGLLTRDPRMVERKKYGQKKARKRFQFSKR
ncbi:MAG: 30S ribosomal protein S9 [Candidatus Sumerlaeia bacterium]